MKAKKIYENIDDLFKPKNLDEDVIKILFNIRDIYYNEDELGDHGKLMKIWKLKDEIPEEYPYKYFHNKFELWWAGAHSRIILVRIIDRANEILRKLGYLNESLNKSVFQPKEENEIENILNKKSLHKKYKLWFDRPTLFPSKYLPLIIKWYLRINKMNYENKLPIENNTIVRGIFMEDNGDLSFNWSMQNGFTIKIDQDEEESKLFIGVYSPSHDRIDQEWTNSFKELLRIIEEYRK